MEKADQHDKDEHDKDEHDKDGHGHGRDEDTKEEEKKDKEKKEEKDKDKDKDEHGHEKDKDGHEDECDKDDHGHGHGHGKDKDEHGKHEDKDEHGHDKHGHGHGKGGHGKHKDKDGHGHDEHGHGHGKGGHGHGHDDDDDGDCDDDDPGPPCFVAGTLIAVPGGQRAVEDLRPGDLVETLDHGPLPVRWVGRRRVSGRGRFAPVRITRGALGNDRDLLVSPQHRMLVRGWRAELLLGDEEVLCPAVALCNGDTIHRAPRDRVDYLHIMFDDHEVVLAEGAPSESFLYGDYLCRDGSALQRELAALFPELAAQGRPRPARQLARGFEARLLGRSL